MHIGMPMCVTGSIVRASPKTVISVAHHLILFASHDHILQRYACPACRLACRVVVPSKLSQSGPDLQHNSHNVCIAIRITFGLYDD